MSDIIQLLPDHVANQIAAGEVVQRPGSVAKELLENSIDADATHIKLIIKEAGKTLIQVIDNGKGMSPTDARLSFERHATSKIAKAEDLFLLETKGFRGEALASIAAIAHVEMKTKQASQDLGTLLKVEGSKVTEQEVVTTPVGTSIAVKNLFYNIPARRNFLKSTSIETRHLIDEFQRVALAHPNIGFSMYHNENELYNLKISNLRQRIVSLFGKRTNEKLVPINEETDIITIQGFVAKPEFAKKKRGEQFFFVNSRFIKSAYLNHAVTSAFDELLSPGYFPTYFLYLTVPPGSIDINIHPTKTEIKFDNEKALYAILRATIKHGLGQFNVAPVLDFNKDSSMETPYTFTEDNPPKIPIITVDPTFNPFKSDPAPNYPKKTFSTKPTDNWESLYVDLEPSNTEFEPISREVTPITPIHTAVQIPLIQEDPPSSKTYQLHNKYIISNIKSGLVVIHQHLAHQRILYEEYLENSTIKEAMSQQLLFPLSLSFIPSDIALIQELKGDLESTGFGFETIADETVVVKGIPTTISESQVSIILEQLLEDIKNEIPDASFSQVDILAKSMAKSMAIKTGTTLDVKEQEEIVNKLFSCKDPNSSPYGKTTFVTMGIDEIDKKFNS
ncbi:MAG: DNA mismatch repair endonuclease MutL [Flavobacteriaceae bacterium]|nr:DNA mismatch repair endonuclease MutL [Flavobacteriaceae bacterium]